MKQIYQMRKLLFLSSAIFIFTTIVLCSCKVKKNKKKQEIVTDTEEVEVDEYKQKNGVIRAPGTINPKQLDSIKSIRLKEKLKEPIK